MKQKINSKIKEIKFLATKSSGSVSGILQRPANSKWLLVFGHGAGAGMKHPFMESVSNNLAELYAATFRYQFPYMEQQKKRPDPLPILMETVRSAVKAAINLADDLPVFAGGKSLGGRMTSMAESKEHLLGIKGLIFFGFPLHQIGNPSIERAEHLFNINIPMLFLQGTRDKLADINLMKNVCKKLGGKSSLHIAEGADHSFHLLKSSGRNDKDVLRDINKAAADWILYLKEV